MVYPTFQMMLIILSIVQVPMTRGTLQLNSELSGTIRNTMSSPYLAISLTCMCRIMHPSCVFSAQPYKVQLVVN